MKILFLLPTLLLIGCASPANYQHAMDSWNGETTQRLTKTWGHPEITEQKEMGEIYIYNRKSVGTRANCQSQFLIQDSKVKGWRSVGACYLTDKETGGLTAEAATWRTKEKQVADDAKKRQCTSSSLGGFITTTCE